MNLLERAAAWLRGALAEQSWLSDWQATIAAAPDWALLAAGPTAVALLALMLWASWPKRRTPDASATSKSRRSTEPSRLTTAVAFGPTPEVPPKIQAASAVDDEDNRSVRVFVSSTFLDMQAERRELVTKVFPALRAKYRARDVEVFEVDLRWGITREQQERGETLPTLFAEIDRCRPYFIGFLGDRFGWVPPSQARSTKLKADYPAVADAEGMSVTAMEIMHGVLANPATAARAIFFERASNWDWVSTLDEADRAAAAMETDDARAKLSEIKAQVRRRARVERYGKPEDIRQKVFDALDRLLEARFPEQGAPDAFEQATSLHRAYARERRVLHVGAERYIAALNAWAGDDGTRPMLITGKSGSGKSTLIANWIHAWRGGHAGDIVFEHYLGASPDSADPMLLMRRLWEHLNRATGEVVESPAGNADLMEVSAGLAQRLAQARVTAGRRGSTVLIALDGLDKLSSNHDLRWLPTVPGVNILASSLEVEPKSAALARGFSSLEVAQLTEGERHEFIAGTLQRWRRRLDSQHIARIMQPKAPELAGSPLYLKTVLEELRVSADHTRLSARVEGYRNARDMPDLFDRVLTRLEADCEPGIVGQTLPLIWASRAGLEEHEIVSTTSATPLAWAVLRNGLGDNLRDQQGRLTFSHDYLRQAVEQRYLTGTDAQRAAHLVLADRFDARMPDARQAEELPYQLAKAESWNRLEALLVDLDRFRMLHGRGMVELLGHWLPLKQRGRDPEALLCAAYEAQAGEVARWTQPDVGLAFRLQDFLRFAGAIGGALRSLSERCTAACQRLLGPEHLQTLASMNNLALTLHALGDFEGAQKLFERVLAVQVRLLGPEHPDTLTSMSNVAESLSDGGDLEGAQRLQRQVLDVRTRLLSAEHPDTLTSMNNLAATLSDRGDLEGARRLQEQTLEVRTRLLGPEHRDTLTSMNNLALTLSACGNLEDARKLQEQAVEVMTRLLGPEHPDTLTSMVSLATIFVQQLDIDRAESAFEHIFETRKRLFGPEHPDTLSIADILRHFAEQRALHHVQRK